MDQKSIVLFLALQGKNATDIHNELVEYLGYEAIEYSTVTYHLRNRSFTASTPPAPDRPEDEGPTASDKAILSALGEQPFASVRQLARATHLPSSTVFYHLTKRLGFTVRHLRWVPHCLSAKDKQIRADVSRELLALLQRHERTSWRNIVTLDESWFYLETDYEQVWIPQDAEPPERQRLTIQSKKLMITVVWTPLGFARIAALPKGVKFNSDYYISEILSPLLAWHRRTAGGGRGNLIVHADNARPHKSKKVRQFMERNKMEMAPHPPYSPDLAPCDFFLFGAVKGRLQGRVFEEPDQLLTEVRALCQSYANQTLTRVFLDWMKRLRRTIDSDGDLVRDC
jgi:hypothetical protein